MSDKKKFTSAEYLNIFFFLVIGAGLFFLSSSFDLATTEQFNYYKEHILKYFTIRFLMWYLIGVVFVLLIGTANRVLIKTQVIESFSYKRLINLGLIIMAVIVFLGTYTYFN